MNRNLEHEPGIRLIERAADHGDRPAILSEGRAFSYADLLRASETVARVLLGSTDRVEDLKEERIAYLVQGSFEYAAVQWGVWRSGGLAVPLSASAKEPELEHVLTDAAVSRVLVSAGMEDRIEGLYDRLGIGSMTVEEAMEGWRGPDTTTPDPRFPGVDGDPTPDLPNVTADRRAMMLYTSGTTSKPKGVVTTHANIEAQIRALVQAWGWRADDRIPLFLPLHHVHGIVNVLSCALWSGAQVETFPGFDLDTILRRVGEDAYTVFMAVPTIYVKLIAAVESTDQATREFWTEGFRRMRLMISGSAALPAATHEKWTALTGQELLERYGMTEIGMGLSNPLEGERRPGAVGQPLPGVELRLVSEAGEVIEGEDEPGEIQVKGPAVFTEYWNLPSVTAEAFQDGWFRTGDMAVLEDGYYRILGRLSVDIIKSGGYKLSALEIEDVLRQHPRIQECAVVGVADDVWGEAVAAAVVTADGEPLGLDDLKAWAGYRLSSYKVPKHLLGVADFPRNAMGKVMKPAVRALFEAE